MSMATSNWERVGKPFNPLLGETYELDRYMITSNTFLLLYSYQWKVSVISRHIKSNFCYILLEFSGILIYILVYTRHL